MRFWLKQSRTQRLTALPALASSCGVAVGAPRAEPTKPRNHKTPERIIPKRL